MIIYRASCCKIYTYFFALIFNVLLLILPNAVLFKDFLVNISKKGNLSLKIKLSLQKAEAECRNMNSFKMSIVLMIETSKS